MILSKSPTVFSSGNFLTLIFFFLVLAIFKSLIFQVLLFLPLNHCCGEHNGWYETSQFTYNSFNSLYGKKFAAKKGMIPKHLHSSHTCNVDTLRHPCPSDNPLWIPPNAPSDQVCFGYLAGIMWNSALWFLLGTPCTGTTAIVWPCRSELLRSPGPGTSQGWPLMVSVIPLTVHWCHTLNKCVCRRWVSPLGLLPHMISPNVSSCRSCTPDGTLFTDCQPIILLLWQKYHIFPSVIPIPSSPYWQRSLK